MTNTRIICIAAILLAVQVATAAQQTPVNGRVVDESGHKVAPAWVSALRLDEPAHSGRVEWVPVTDAAEFQLLLAPGRYLIRAKSEGLLYPDPSFLLSRDSSYHFPEIEVRQAVHRGVVVKLGRKGFAIQGRVRRPDGQPANGAKVTIRKTKDASSFVILTANSDGRFESVVPSVDVLISTRFGEEEVQYNRGSPVTGAPGSSIDVDLVVGSRKPEETSFRLSVEVVRAESVFKAVIPSERRFAASRGTLRFGAVVSCQLSVARDPRKSARSAVSLFRPPELPKPLKPPKLGGGR